MCCETFGPVTAITGLLWANRPWISITKMEAPTWPEELALVIHSEPVDMKNRRHLCLGLLRPTQPVLQVPAKVVAKEWPHGKGIPHDHLALEFSSCSCFWWHGWRQEYTMLPVEGFIDQGHPLGSPTTEQYAADWNSVGVLPIFIHHGAESCWGAEPWVWMCCFGSAWLPVLLIHPTLDAHTFSWWLHSWKPQKWYTLNEMMTS